MTRRNLSPEAFRQMFTQEGSDPFLLCLTLTHSGLAAPIRLVRDSQPLLRSAGEFTPCFFDLSLPDENPDAPPQVQLTVDNVNQLISRSIRLLQGRVKCTLEVVLASQPNVVEVGPFDLYLLTSSYDASKVTGTLGYEDDVLNQTFPAQSYNPENTPGLFR